MILREAIMPKVKFDNISKVFANYTAVRDLNFEIDHGEFVVFVGPSGCGKTTTLRMLAGLEIPSYGRLTFDDVDVTTLAPGRRDVSMVFQSYALYPHMTVYKNLSFGPESRGEQSGATESRIHEVARLLGLDSMLGRKPGELSGGQRQRVALGRAMIRKPKVFLLDEPLSNLDAALRTQMRIEIADLQRRLGVTTVYVTHDQVEALTMGHRVAVFNKGELLQIDTPRNLYKSPVDRFVATFIGSPKMNLLPGTLVTNVGMVALQVLGLTSVTATDWQARVLEGAGSRDIQIGLRPQDIHWVQDAPSRCNQTISGTVHAVEPTGAETFVLVDIQGQQIEARFPSFSAIRIGDVVNLAYDLADIYVFDRASGRNLMHGIDLDEARAVPRAYPALVQA
jgi:multiple sugar transport system ATP-binding protein